MTLQRKDYELVARAIQRAALEAGVKATVEHHDLVVSCLADAFASDNPNFKRAVFVAACEVGGLRK